MLFADEPASFTDKNWRRINMRKVDHLIAAESLHNLYGRHWSRINSLRFRHTVTNFHNGTVESYAPVEEWNYLQHWLSKKFLSLDPVLLREIRSILNPDYQFIDELLEKIDSTDLKKSTNQELALLLIDIMDYPLGEIYKLNVVQIEHSLNFAIHTLLEKYEPSLHDRNLLIAQLIAPGELTVAQEEEVAFSRIVARGRRTKTQLPAENAYVKKQFLAHVDQFAPTHCAYGELPPNIDDYVVKYSAAYASPKILLTRRAALKNISNQLDKSRAILNRISDVQLTELCELMAAIGVFRDRNKAKLGETVIRRLKILDAISAHTGEKRDSINYYLVAELTRLLDQNSKLESSVLRSRKLKGVHFVRSEDVIIGQKQIQHSLTDRSNTKNLLRGTCASPGKINGTIRIIHSRKDAYKMKIGDIMVAVGTDFDLIEIMNMSSGIITEEGGLLSHASVVSRELKKPCLIGVQQASKTLIDGEHVELNATDGVIRRGDGRPHKTGEK